jgi:hypothetical protein
MSTLAELFHAHARCRDPDCEDCATVLALLEILTPALPTLEETCAVCEDGDVDAIASHFRVLLGALTQTLRASCELAMFITMDRDLKIDRQVAVGWLVEGLRLALAKSQLPTPRITIAGPRMAVPRLTRTFAATPPSGSTLN